MSERPKLSEREITPPEVYFNRRNFMRAGPVAGSAIVSGSVYRWFNPAKIIQARLPSIAARASAATARHG